MHCLHLNNRSLIRAWTAGGFTGLVTESVKKVIVYKKSLTVYVI